jgi:hypothetical protein
MAPRPKSPLTLAGTARHQEANRKRLARELRSLAWRCKMTAARSARLCAIVESCDIAAIAAGSEKTRHALAAAANLDDQYVTYAIERLLGVNANEVDLVSLLLDLRGKNWAPAATTGTSPSQGPSIVNGEIDWTREPFDDRERAIRLKIIRGIEVENKHAVWTYSALQDLNGGLFPTSPAASDLDAALTRWEALWKAESAAEDAAKRREQLLAAENALNGDQLEEQGVTSLSKWRQRANA